MTRIRVVFAEALRSIGANVSTTVASALSVLIGMFLIGVFIGLGTWLVSWSDDKKRELAVHVFIADTATKKEINGLRIHLESDKRVKPGGITFITKDRALEIMSFTPDSRFLIATCARPRAREGSSRCQAGPRGGRARVQPLR